MTDDYTTARQKVADLAAALTDEDEGFLLLHALRVRFGWEGTMFSPEFDVRDRLVEALTDRLEREPSDTEVTAAFDAFYETYEWGTAIQDRMTEAGWEVIDMALTEAISMVSDVA